MFKIIYDFFPNGFDGYWLCFLLAFAYLIYGQSFGKKEKKKKDEKKEEEDETIFFNGESAQDPDSVSSRIIIAADATPERAGGLIYLPRDKVVYYYTVDWRHVFDFSGHASDKFEMTNSLVALELFRIVSGDCRHRYDKLVLKVDNTFCTGNSYKRNAGYRKLFEEIDQKLKQWPFFGEWGYTPGKDDVHIRIADMLSRAKDAQALKLIQQLEFAVDGIECSNEFCNITLNYVKNTIVKLGNSNNLYRELLRFLNHQPNVDPYTFIGESIPDPNTVEREILIAVNSTPERAGGLMYIPADKNVYYYSVNWSNIFEFSGLPDYKFKMVNSLLALELFEDFLNLNRFCYKKLVLKVDNKFCIKHCYKKKGGYTALFKEISKKLQQHPFFGGWLYTSNQRDKVINIANMLSRGKEDQAFQSIRLLGFDVHGIKYANNFCNAALYRVKTTIRELINSSDRNRELEGLVDESILLSY